MDFQVVEHARHSPTCCFICKESEGPFVHVPSIEFTDVATSNGRETIEGDVYICIGRDVLHVETGAIVERKIGCARTLGRLGDCVTPDEVDGWRAAIEANRTLLMELEAREQALILELKEEREKSKLVSVDELFEKIAPAASADV